MECSVKVCMYLKLMHTLLKVNYVYMCICLTVLYQLTVGYQDKIQSLHLLVCLLCLLLEMGELYVYFTFYYKSSSINSSVLHFDPILLTQGKFIDGSCKFLFY